MKFSFPYKRLLILSLIGGLVTGPLLTSCGGSGDGQVAGIGGTGITQGEITAFGSIFVNGVEFETDNSEFDVDGDTSLGQDALEIGMVVTITGDKNDDGVTGTAKSLKYDDAIQGPVVIVNPTGDGEKTLSIFGQSIVIDDLSTKFKGTTFDSIVEDDILEISGFKTSSTQIKATFVEKTGEISLNDKEVEFKGTITDLSASSFKISGITINYNSTSTVIDTPSGSLSDDLFVEVKGDLQSATSIFAREVELEDADFDEGAQLSLQGVITNFTSSASFQVADQPVDASGIASLAIGLSDGLNVEVEGEIVNGVLVANEIEPREGSVEIEAKVTTTIGDQIQFNISAANAGNPLLVKTNNQTQYEDEVSSLPNFSFSDLAPDDFVKIDGFESEGEILASRVQRTDPTDQDTEIQGKVTAYSEGESITILGLTFELGVGESYQPPVQPSSITVGSIIEVVDKSPIDGTIDEVESE